ncbi:MAG: 2-dehydro-3-deoxyphosphogluconate aldolase [Actinomycetota bacterium]|nr:2-dehydro-3-deoxyphosphogluconate aldolase [Actinomycetota bacterium]
MRPDVPEAIAGPGVVAVIRKPPLPPRQVIEAVAAGGIGAVEITLNTPGALREIAELVTDRPTGLLLIGAGTILEVADAEAAAVAGAEMIVTPVASVEVVRWGVANGIPVIPGAHTATEIHTVWRAGACAVKVYPYITGGVDHLRTLMGPLPEVRYLAFGGVTVADAVDVTMAGGIGVGVGPWLTDETDPDEITARARRVLDAVAEGRRRRNSRP